ncbi:hypothetical protein QR98_0094450 [Sarcoptes scabiei]|uniref:Uncharacterized protein n=1 Tax=Sarcoptes scabiei TaxID=52283 RepID=A0A132AKD0_SARSC|nr:hypothetical protein QR98_0094450 [Sarcoptes scabiei]
MLEKSKSSRSNPVASDPVIKRKPSLLDRDEPSESFVANTGKYVASSTYSYDRGPSPQQVKTSYYHKLESSSTPNLHPITLNTDQYDHHQANILNSTYISKYQSPRIISEYYERGYHDLPGRHELSLKDDYDKLLEKSYSKTYEYSKHYSRSRSRTRSPVERHSSSRRKKPLLETPVPERSRRHEDRPSYSLPSSSRSDNLINKKKKVALLPTPVSKTIKKTTSKEHPKLTSSERIPEKRIHEKMIPKTDEVKVLEERVKLLEKLIKDQIENKSSAQNNKQNKIDPDSARTSKIPETTGQKRSREKESIQEDLPNKRSKLTTTPNKEEKFEPQTLTASNKLHNVREKNLIEPKSKIPMDNDSVKAKETPKKPERERLLSENEKREDLFKENKKPKTEETRRDDRNKSRSNSPGRHRKPIETSPATIASNRLSDEEIESDLNRYQWCNICRVFFLETAQFLEHIHRDSHIIRLSSSDFQIIEKALKKINCDDESNSGLQHSSSSSSANSEFSIATDDDDCLSELGSEFIYPLKSFYCDLCSKILPTTQSTIEHYRTERHNKLYQKFLKKNVDFYKKFNRNRLFEFKKSPFLRHLMRRREARLLQKKNDLKIKEECEKLLDSMIDKIIRNETNRAVLMKRKAKLSKIITQPSNGAIENKIINPGPPKPIPNLPKNTFDHSNGDGDKLNSTECNTKYKIPKLKPKTAAAKIDNDSKGDQAKNSLKTKQLSQTKTVRNFKNKIENIEILDDEEDCFDVIDEVQS